MDFICSQCGHRGLVPRTAIGKAVRCPKCKAASVVRDKDYRVGEPAANVAVVLDSQAGRAQRRTVWLWIASGVAAAACIVAVGIVLLIRYHPSPAGQATDVALAASPEDAAIIERSKQELLAETQKATSEATQEQAAIEGAAEIMRQQLDERLTRMLAQVDVENRRRYRKRGPDVARIDLQTWEDALPGFQEGRHKQAGSISAEWAVRMNYARAQRYEFLAREKLELLRAEEDARQGKDGATWAQVAKRYAAAIPQADQALKAKMEIANQQASKEAAAAAAGVQRLLEPEEPAAPQP